LIPLLLANLAPALFLAGIAWFLQVVQLPLLADREDFPRYIRAHRFRNTLLMAPPMLIELAASVNFWWASRDVAASLLIVLLAAIWLITFLAIIPGFRRLTSGYGHGKVRHLILWNGVRTACWTARSGILLYIVASGIRT
jgi:hypothetical protein